MSRELNQYSLEILTPIHIGNDDTLQSVSYYHFKGEEYVKVYDIKDICNKIKNIEPVFNIKSRHVSLNNFLNEEEINNIIPSRELLIRSNEHVKGQELNLFVSENNELYIPGSSLKGSILHAVEYANKESKYLHENFGISDLYFEQIVSQLERGERITASKKKGKSKQKQDNYKEWVVLGKTKQIHSFNRKKIDIDFLKSIYCFTKDYLEYQKTYYDYIFEKNDFENQDLADKASNVSLLIDQYLEINTKEEPLLILGSNTHRFSKTNELRFKKSYQLTKGKNSAHPLSRLLVLDKEGYLTMPGLVRFLKNEN
ncbi:MAG: type III-A CRISPR-associated RAMP protein Csm5 [bacterium]